MGLRQIFEINFINTAGLRRMKCEAKFVTPTVGLRQNLTFDNTAGLNLCKCRANLLHSLTSLVVSSATAGVL
jgi:hypothetical protein